MVNISPQEEEHWISFQDTLNGYREQGLELVSIVKDDFLKKSAGSLLLIMKEYDEEA